MLNLAVKAKISCCSLYGALYSRVLLNDLSYFSACPCTCLLWYRPLSCIYSSWIRCCS